MAVNLSPVGGVAAQFFTSTGAVLTGGKLYTYAAGTTTPAATYTTSQGNVPWTNPVVLDAAGRVPGSGEIWLTDGVIYKFVLKDSNDVLIATYDNITGINSNSVAYTNQQEIVTATAGQTVFNLGISYTPGTNSLSVYVDGVNQYGPGAQYSYVETDSNTVTFNTGLHVGAEVKFTTTQQQGAGAVDASQVSYDPPFTGSAITNVENKLAQTISVKDFGAVGNGTTDDSAAWNAAVAYCAANNLCLYAPSVTAFYKLDSNVAVNCSFSAGRYRLFGGTGTVTFSNGAVNLVFPEWWATNTTPGTTDMTAAVQAAINTGYRVSLAAVDYSVKDLEVLVDTFEIGGEDLNLSRLVARAGSAYVLKLGNNLNGAAGTKGIGPCLLEQFTIVGTAPIQGTLTDCYGVKLDYATRVTIQNVYIDKCSGAIVPICADRLKLDSVLMTANYAGIYYDESVFTVPKTPYVACSGTTFLHCHTRENKYGVLLAAARTDFDITFISGYWGGNGADLNSSGETGQNDIYVDGGCRFLKFYGVNFENSTDSPASVKPEIIRVGIAHTAGHIGVDEFLFDGCTFFDNNATINASKLIRVIDSGSLTYPSLRNLIFQSCYVQNIASSPFNIPNVASAVFRGVWFNNETSASSVYPTQNCFLVNTNGDRLPVFKYAFLDQPAMVFPTLTPTSGFALRASDTNSVVLNTGAVSTKAYTLPQATSALIGYVYIIQNVAAQAQRVTPYSGDTILGTGGANKYVQTEASIKSSMSIVCVAANTWAVMFSTGTITYEP